MSDEAVQGTATAPGSEPTTAAQPAGQTASAAPQAAPQLGSAPAAPAGPWHQSLPDDLRGNELFSRFATQEDALRGYAEANKLIGKKEIVQGLVAPGANASDAEKQAFRSQLNEMTGVPSEVAGYTLNGAPINEELNEFAGLAHGLHMSDEQFNGLAQGLVQMDEAARTKAEESIVAAEKANLQLMQGEWGAQYDQNMATANKALEAFGNDELSRFIEESRANNEPAVIRLFHTLGQQLEEGTLKIGDGGTEKPVASVQDELDKLQREDAFWNPSQDGGVTRRRVGELKMQLGKQGT